MNPTPAAPKTTGSFPWDIVLYCAVVGVFIALEIWQREEREERARRELEEAKRRNDFLDRHNKMHEEHNGLVRQLFADFELVSKKDPEVRCHLLAQQTPDTKDGKTPDSEIELRVLKDRRRLKRKNLPA